jgi:hypothetical protein
LVQVSTFNRPSARPINPSTEPAPTPTTANRSCRRRKKYALETVQTAGQGFGQSRSLHTHIRRDLANGTVAHYHRFQPAVLGKTAGKLIPDGIVLFTAVALTTQTPGTHPAGYIGSDGQPVSLLITLDLFSNGHHITRHLVANNSRIMDTLIAGFKDAKI